MLSLMIVQNIVKTFSTAKFYPVLYLKTIFSIGMEDPPNSNIRKSGRSSEVKPKQEIKPKQEVKPKKEVNKKFFLVKTKLLFGIHSLF